MVSRLSALILIVFLLGGCTQWRHYELGRPIVRSEVPQPEEGWTVSEVMLKFGPPLLMSSETGGYVMAWEYWEIDEYRVGVGSFITGVDLINIDWGKAQVKGDFMVLGFDRQHRLRSASFEEWDRNAGGGQGVQPVLSPIEVVDVDDLTVPLTQHLWGAQSLRRLPVTLNQQNRLDSGQAGIEQRGGTRGVGQRTLEHR